MFYLTESILFSVSNSKVSLVWTKTHSYTTDNDYDNNNEAKSRSEETFCPSDGLFVQHTQHCNDDDKDDTHSHCIGALYLPVIFTYLFAKIRMSGRLILCQTASQAPLISI